MVKNTDISLDRCDELQNAAIAENGLAPDENWSNIKRESDRFFDGQTVTIKINVGARYEIEREYFNNESTIFQLFWSNPALQIEIVSQSLGEPISLLNSKNQNNLPVSWIDSNMPKVDRDKDALLNNLKNEIKRVEPFICLNASVDTLTGVAAALPGSKSDFNYNYCILSDRNSTFEVDFHPVNEQNLDNCDRLLPIVPIHRHSISRYQPKRQLVTR